MNFGPFLRVSAGLLLGFWSEFGTGMVQAFRISFCLLKGSLLDVAFFVGTFGPILELGTIFDVGFELGGCPPGMLLRCFSLCERLGQWDW